MSDSLVAVVSRDPTTRLAAAAAFDGAPATWRVELVESPPPDGADVVVLGPDAGEGPGVRFDPAAPHRLLDDVARVLGRQDSLTVVVTGAGGGVGTTSVALHLAQALAAGAETCVVDLGRDRAVALRLGLGATAVPSWGDLEPGDASLRRCAVPVAGGFRVLLAPETDDSSHTSIPELVRRTAADFERVVVDVSAGARQHAALRAVRTAVLVVAPSVVGAATARPLLAAHPGIAWAVVLNRLGPGGETTRAVLERLLRHPVAMELGCAPSLRDSEDDGRLLTSPLSPWRRAVHRLARALVANAT
jgi:Mrp family chromosome partitioning ATPase